jgi:hypothetical protein
MRKALPMSGLIHATQLERKQAPGIISYHIILYRINRFRYNHQKAFHVEDRRLSPTEVHHVEPA